MLNPCFACAVSYCFRMFLLVFVSLVLVHCLMPLVLASSDRCVCYSYPCCSSPVLLIVISWLAFAFCAQSLLCMRRLMLLLHISLCSLARRRSLVVVILLCWLLQFFLFLCAVARRLLALMALQANRRRRRRHSEESGGLRERKKRGWNRCLLSSRF